MRLIILSVLTCCVMGTICDSSPCDTCPDIPANVRIKRAKYYSSPPQRFYKRPPMSYPTRGAFSYTPPPNHMVDDEEQPPPNHRPQRYSRRPSSDGLGDEDINNLLKYLSKNDLDKIVERTLANDKFKKGFHDKPFDIPKLPNNNNEDDNGKRFSLSGPYIKPSSDYAQTAEDSNFDENYVSESRPIVIPDTTQNLPANLHFYSPSPNEETDSFQQFAVVDGYMKQAINGLGSQSDVNIFTDSRVMEEEQLPIPSNLRYEDHYASFTNTAPAAVWADASSYKVESFGNLPLMNYDSKLHTVSSYKVPHYTVTTSNNNQPAVPSQPPPPTGNARVELSSSRETKYPDQSDAHLKATKIWTHKSTGTAYYLHKDGTLSLERPQRSHPKYG